MKNRSLVVLSRVLTIALVFAFATMAFAQIQNGVFTGTVTDPQGSAVAGADVTLTNIDTGFSTTVKSGNNGVYTTQSLPVGNYKLSVKAAGFKTAEKPLLKLDVGTTQRQDVKLALGKVEETVEVTTEAAIINTEDNKLTSNVSSGQIASLPLNGRNVYDLIQLAPGAVNVKGVLTENGANTVVNGVREDFNGFMLNGVSNKGLSGGAVNQPIQDTVQEFQLLTLNTSAQYGNSAASVTNLVTKSGTNSFHGSVFGFLRNRNLDANDYFLNQQGLKKPPLDFKQFGGTIGGPIVKDKLFFYFGYQGDRFLASSNPSVVQVESPQFRAAAIAANPNSVAALLYKGFTPANSGAVSDCGGVPCTVDNYIANVSSSGLGSQLGYMCNTNVDNPATPGATTVAQRFGNLFGVTAATNTALVALGCSPLALTPGTLTGATPFLVDAVNLAATQNNQPLGNLFDGNEYSARVDYTLSANDRLFGQLNWFQNEDKPAASISLYPLRGFKNPVKNKNPNVQFSYTHVFSPTIVNEFKAGYAGNLATISVSQGGVPQINFDDGSLGFGSYSGYPQTFHENIYTYSDLVSITKGKHNIKTGVDVRRNIENSEFNVARPSYYFFDPFFFAADAPYNEVAGVDPGFVSGTTAHLQSNVRHWRNIELGAYFQDDWKITPRLTLNLGLRYDLYTRHNEENNQVTTFIPGPGTTIIDQIRNANALAGTTRSIGGTTYDCTSATAQAKVVLAGVCGPGGFAAAKSLGAPDHNNFGPRVGFAWDVFGNGKTSLRGGYGLSYEGTLYNPLSNSRWNPPYYSFNSVTNYLNTTINNGPTTGVIVYGPQSGGTPSFTGAPDPLNNQGTGGAQAQGNIGGWAAGNPNQANLTGIVLPSGIKDPYVHSGFLQIQHEILPKTTIEMAWVGTYGHKLFRAENINTQAGGKLPAGACITTQDALHRQICSANTPNGRPNGNYGNLRLWANVVSSNYEGMQLGVKHQMTRGLAFNVNWTWSHALDTGSTWHSGATSANGASGGEGYLTDLAVPSIDYGNSIFDIRHRVVFNYVWDLPSFKDSNAFVRYTLGGWSYNGIVSYQSGAHYSAFNSRGASLAKTPACAAATFNAATCVNNGGDYNLDAIANDRPNTSVSNYNPSSTQWANGWGAAVVNSIFSAPCLGCVGTERRNQFVGPSFIGADMSLFKNFSLTERFKMQFRWEVFNVFNHTNFELPGAEGAGRNKFNNAATFGRAGGAFNPRQQQLGLKFSF